MKKHMNRFSTAILMAGSIAMVSPALADKQISSFDFFTSDALYASWGSAAIVSGATSYDVTATGYGSNYKSLGGNIDASGNTNVQLTVTLSGPEAASGHLGPIVNLIDADGTEYAYAWYGQLLGPLVLNKAVTAPTTVVAVGTTPGLDLTTINQLHLQLDPGGFGAAGAYTVSWQDLSLTGAFVPPPPSSVTISTFDNFNLDGLFPSWTAGGAVSGATSYSMTATGYGSGYEALAPVVNGTAGADGKLGPIATLVDGDGTEYVYAWYGQTLGQHVLNMAVNTPTSTAAAGTVPGLDLSTLSFFHLQLDPSTFTSGAYTVAWENFRLTGAGSGSSSIQITSQSYNNATHQLTLTWTSSPGATYTVLHTTVLANGFSPLVTNIASGGNSTTTTVTLPAATQGFVRVQQQ